MSQTRWLSYLIVVIACCGGGASYAQTVKSEDFTGPTSSNPWYFFNGACLTASTTAATTNPGTIPGCTALKPAYYNENLVGGAKGATGTAETLPDDDGAGALRLTNGSPGGFNQSGAIVSASPFPTARGIQITFKTVTYRGNSGGSGKDGADGISFFLMDASKSANIGAFGGSLGYSCSNSNSPYNGLVGAYLGLGIDEYGNFLNGTSLMSGYTGPNSATGDNTAWGYGYKPGRIGMRGAGSISLDALTTAYGTNPGSGSMPYYPASLASTCKTGVYDSTSKLCTDICSSSSGTYLASLGACGKCSTGSTLNTASSTCDSCSDATYKYNTAFATCSKCTLGTYSAATNQCLNVCSTGTFNGSTNKCDICTTGTYNSTSKKCENICTTGVFDASRTKCEICASGYTYNPGPRKCMKGSLVGSLTEKDPTSVNPTTATPTGSAAMTTTPTQAAPTTTASTTSQPVWPSAVQKTCSTGHLWNYYDPFNPSDAGTATLDNPYNTAGILDYAPIPNAYTELSSLATPLTIAKEDAMKRGDAVPIFYNVKITQDGLLSLQYSVNGGAYQSVIKDQSITTSNGPVPDNVFFGLAGSTGGSTNIHEIMCFKAAPDQTSGSSTSVNERLAAKVQAGTQAYFAFYDQNNWTGALTANDLIDTAGVISVATTANWDASCGLTGLVTGKTCSTTGVAGPKAAQGSVDRVMLSCRGSCNGTATNRGIAFDLTKMNTSQKAALNATDSQGTNRVGYLRGDRGNEITTVGSGLFRKRDGVLGDIVDSSPIWVGPPLSPYASAWVDRLPANPSGTPDTLSENSASQTYQQYVDATKTRLNVVYAGANDGFMHGFRSGSFTATGTFVDNTSTPNDGREVIAYMPAAILKTIHSGTDPGVDYSAASYGHNFFVDATPTADDLFYNDAWHTWLVGGLGEGGAAIYALDITDPTQFSEANAASLVIGEWGPANISCSGPGDSTCGNNLGKTYGTPQIRRMHNGTWGVIFGNGFDSLNGDGGIYIMTVDPADASKKFYYLTTNTAAAGGNGIAYVSPVDLDGDHITDYVYAGDLKGNVWRFDLTSTDPANWAASSAPLFTTPSGQPITTKVQPVVTLATNTSQPQVMVEFGTGRKTLLTNTAPTSYITGKQALYGLWDWNLDDWNSRSSVKYRSLSGTDAGLATMDKSNLQAQTFSASGTSTGNIDGTNTTVCWKGLTVCSSSNSKFGWYVDLPTASGIANEYEQVVFNPLFYQGAFIINSTVPANNTPTSCAVPQDTGFSYVISATTGGTLPNAFPSYHDAILSGVATSATGTPYVVTTVEGTTNIVYQTVSGTPGAQLISVPKNTKAKRVTWVELR